MFPTSMYKWHWNKAADIEKSDYEDVKHINTLFTECRSLTSLQ